MFRNDYSEICAPCVLDAVARCMNEQNIGYGLDTHSANAERLILNAFGLDESSAVHFIAAGTQTNMVVISYFLRPYEGVIACDTGHINVHETAAVEGSGHKVYTCTNADGKLKPCDIENAMRLHTDEHMVKLKMVYISDSTETGTIYTAAELKALRKVCDKYGLLLFLDGARLGVALTCAENDVTPQLIGQMCDVFYVGGTKNGAMYGEAVVIKNAAAAPDFRYHVKNRGAMLAKGFIPGIQFEALFENDLYFHLAKNSNSTACLLRGGLSDMGIKLGTSPTNQIFLTVKKQLAQAVMNRYGAELWSDDGAEQTVRLVTSFATKEEDCAELLRFVKDSI